jgi:hypothetical protein
MQFAKPVSLKDHHEDTDSDFDEEFDTRRDPNLDMMYYVGQMPKMHRIKDVDFDIDKSKGALEYLFEERNTEGSFIEDDHYIEEQQRINNFTDKLN